MKQLSYPDADRSNHHSAQRELWAAVIQQAVRDARASVTTIPAKIDRDRAILWLTGASADFRQVCSLAGIDSDAARKVFQKEFQNG